MSTNQPQALNDASPIFGAPIYTYTRAQALDDGEQVDVTATAREAGITFPTYMTRAVWFQFVKVPKGVEGQDERGRLWDILWMLRAAIRRARECGDLIMFQVMVRNTNHRPDLVLLKATCGPVDFDNPQPAITIMLPGED